MKQATLIVLDESEHEQLEKLQRGRRVAVRLAEHAAIFKHESQKDKALFPGIDDREFWQRAEDRNRSTAKLYDQLGLAEYEAIEGFVH